MVRSDPIAEIDDTLRGQLSPYALDEIAKGGEYFDELVRQSCTLHAVTYNDRLIAVVGVWRKTMLGIDTFWFLLGADPRIGDLRALRKITPKLFDFHPHVVTAVERGYVVGERFAKFFGFRPVGDTFEAFGRTYQSYEARRWHP